MQFVYGLISVGVTFRVLRSLSDHRGVPEVDSSREIKAKRDAAAQARRVAISLSDEQDRRRVLALAADLDRQADELERRQQTACKD